MNKHLKEYEQVLEQIDTKEIQFIESMKHGNELYQNTFKIELNQLKQRAKVLEIILNNPYLQGVEGEIAPPAGFPRFLEPPIPASRFEEVKKSWESKEPKYKVGDRVVVSQPITEAKTDLIKGVVAVINPEDAPYIYHVAVEGMGLNCYTEESREIPADSDEINAFIHSLDD